MREYVNFAKLSHPGSFVRDFGGSVGDELNKIGMKYQLETKPHTYADGEVGQVCKKMTIEIEFNDAVVQPHSDFEGEVCGELAETLAGNISGLIENSDDTDEMKEEGYF